MRPGGSSLGSGSRCLGIGLALLLAPSVGLPIARAEETIKLDCGTNALYVLLWIEGHPTTLGRIEALVPPRHPDGYSMAELASASKALGLGLDGVRFDKADKAPDRAAIVFLKDAKGGHFAVIRPVGTTGKMVQVIDPPYTPWIADYDQVLTTKPWTGRVLMRRDPWTVRDAAARRGGPRFALGGRDRSSKVEPLNS